MVFWSITRQTIAFDPNQKKSHITPYRCGIPYCNLAAVKESAVLFHNGVFASRDPPPRNPHFIFSVPNRIADWFQALLMSSDLVRKIILFGKFLFLNFLIWIKKNLWIPWVQWWHFASLVFPYKSPCKFGSCPYQNDTWIYTVKKIS